ncbi:MAG: HD domain-containing protein [Calditrichaceae bacterium]
MSKILEKTKNYAKDLLRDKLTENHVFHNLQHTIDTVEAAEEIAEHSRVSDEEYEILMIAAWLHDIGHVETYEGHEEAGARIAREFLENHAYPDNKINQVVELIMSTKIEITPVNNLQAILHDADIIHIGRKGSFKTGERLREEWKLILDKNFTREEWLLLEEAFYSNSQFYTEYAINTYGETRLENLKKLQKKIGKVESKSQKEIDKEIKKAIKTRVPERGIETVFRSTSRNHIRLSGIADNKANTLISINAIIISIVLSVLIEKLEMSTHLIIPTIIILATCVATIILAVLSTKPKVTKGQISREDIENYDTLIPPFCTD